MAEDNTILVGSKPAMNYVLAVITQFNSSSKKVVLKARCRVISLAVYVAEIVRNKFLPKIKISTDIRGTEGEQTNISAIEIDLA
ncbi:MAG: DNA-binding protein Alba [Methanocellales archaeon]|nr:DNA-binding protein Alba [Methanocellales archaeon]MDD3420830.1 DNA-binding protein Alba [Methanocellales archaeon]MDD4897949.1 DNA-binding protein Alba [Methanocellales archaeon]MDD5446369.1 DNA-binding protein Alba [Methanocellales archaeon]